ncbi:MAG: zinc ribbon domain-containing protein [Candidatus Sericytochromatia bacterium]
MASPLHLASIAATLRRKGRCPRCGHKKALQARICPYCGKKPAPGAGLAEAPSSIACGGLMRLLQNFFRRS